MSQVAASLEPRKGPKGQFYCAEYDVGVTFGGTELKGFVEWEENVRFMLKCVAKPLMTRLYRRGLSVEDRQRSFRMSLGEG